MKKKLEDGDDKSTAVVSFEYAGKQVVDRESGLQMADLTTEQVRVYLNRAPAKYAYYAAMLSRAKKEYRKLDDDFEYWKAKAYSTVDANYPKKTEGFKKNQVIIDNVVAYRKRREQLSELQFVMDQLEVLVRAYEMQSRTLQTVGSLLKAEMELR